MRKAAVIVAVVVLALVLLAVLLPRVVSLESLKPRIVAAMEEKTGRKVAFSRLSLSLFPGVGVKISDLTVSGDPGHADENLLSVPAAEIRVAIAPLLVGRAEFTKFILHRPRVLFRRYANGTHSATEIANRLGRQEKAVPSAPREKVSVSVRSIDIEEAALTVLLEGENGREDRWTIDPFTFRLSGIGDRRNEFEIETRIDGTVRGEIVLSGSAVHEAGPVADPSFFTLAANGKVFGQPLTVEGRMSAPAGQAEADLAISLPKIALEDLRKILASPPARLVEASPEGLASLVLKLSGNLEAMGFEAELDLTRAGWKVTPEIRKYIDIPCTVIAQGHRFPDALVLSNAELKFPPLLLIANASMTPSTGGREWSLSARVASLADFARSRGTGLSRWAPTGRLTMSGKGRRAGASAKEDWTVGIDLGEAGFLVPEKELDLRSLNGHLEITPRSVEFLPLAGLLNGQRFALNGSVARGPVAVGKIDLRMVYLDLDALFPPGGTGRGKPSAKPAPKPAPSRKGGEAEAQAFAARGTITIDAGKARGIEFRDLSGSLRYEEGSLVVDALRAKLYGGELQSSGSVLLREAKPDFRLKVAMNKVAVGEILSRKTSLGNFLSGSGSLTADIGGQWSDYVAFSRTAAGVASVRIDDGKIRGVDLIGEAVGAAGLGSVLTGAAGAGRSTETSFKEMSADFRIGGGKMRTDALRIVSDKAALSGAAVIGFDRTFDFRGGLTLSPELSQRVRGTAGQFLTGTSGQVEIPLVLSGPVTSPAMAIDAKRLVRGAAEKAIRGLTEELTGKPQDKGGTAPEKKPGGAEPKDAVEDLFQRLLPGRK